MHCIRIDFIRSRNYRKCLEDEEKYVIFEREVQGV